MGLIRPEIVTALHRWRDVLSGAALAGLGVYWVLGSGGAVAIFGWVLVIAGSGLVVTGAVRAQFVTTGNGPGMVSVVEGKITYFGPLTGGSADLSEISGLGYDPTGRPAHWILDQPGQPSLAIPVTADGAETLFDLFSSLPGVNSTMLLQATRSRHRAQLWRR